MRVNINFNVNERNKNKIIKIDNGINHISLVIDENNVLGSSIHNLFLSEEIKSDMITILDQISKHIKNL